MLRKAALVAAYTDERAMPACTLTEVLSTTEAGLASTGSSACSRKYGPLTLMAKEASKACSVHSSIGTQTETPALRKTTSSWP